MIRRILAPTDFSDVSLGAVRYAAELADPFGAQLVLLHVGATVDEEQRAVPGARADIMHRARAETARIVRHRVDKLVAELRAAHPGVAVEATVASGPAHQAILDAAERSGADLIVMGTSGLTGFSRFFIGSTAERVVRLSKVPVVTVRAPA